jgi:hypothetical protein
MPASCGLSRARIIPSTYHGFAQVWFILKGGFTIDGRLCPPGTMLYHPDPHFEGAFHTATGGEILIVQYPGPSTGERPIYAGRIADHRAVGRRHRNLGKVFANVPPHLWLQATEVAYSTPLQGSGFLRRTNCLSALRPPASGDNLSMREDSCRVTLSKALDLPRSP